MEIKDISLPEAEYGFEMSSNQFIQDLHVTPEKMDYWINKHCYGGYVSPYTPAEQVEYAHPQKEIPPRFFVPLVISLKKDSLWMGETKLEEKDWDDLTISSDKLFLKNLHDSVAKKIELYRRFADSCSYSYKITYSNMMLLGVDQSVSQFQLQRVLYTLSSAGVSSFAFLVDDVAPEKYRENSQIAGFLEEITEEQLVDCDQDCLEALQTQMTTMQVNPKEFEWTTSKNETKTLSTTSTLPKYLGEDYPPKAFLYMNINQTVDSLFVYHDALAGAGVFCTDWGGAFEDVTKEENTRSEGVSPNKTLQIGRNQKVSVHLLEASSSGQYVHRRVDEVLCSGVLKMPMKGRMEEIHSPHSLDLLNLLSDPLIQNLNLLEEKIE